MAIKPGELMGGFAKGLAVIEAFDRDRSRLSIAEVAAITGLDRATARRCLLTLSENGYARYDGKFFELTPRILRLGHGYLSGTPLPVLLQPHLETLSECVGQSVSASVLDGDEIVYIARASQKRVISINLMPGSRLPAYCSSMGRVLLAALPDGEVRAILAASRIRANTPYTKTSLPDLLVEIGKVRVDGYAVINQELELGLCSIAVPLRDRRGRTVAAVNLGMPAGQVEAGELAGRYLTDLRQVQTNLEPLLG